MNSTLHLPGDNFLVPLGGVAGPAIEVAQYLNGSGFKKYQHVGTYLGNDLTVEASPGGAIQGNIKVYDPAKIYWSSGLIILTDDERRRICEIARTYIGTPYSYLDYLSLAALRLHVRPKWLTDYVEDTGHMICSQLADRIAYEAGVHLFADGRFAGDVTPADWENLLNKLAH